MFRRESHLELLRPAQPGRAHHSPPSARPENPPGVDHRFQYGAARHRRYMFAASPASHPSGSLQVMGAFRLNQRVPQGKMTRFLPLSQRFRWRAYSARNSRSRAIAASMTSGSFEAKRGLMSPREALDSRFGGQLVGEVASTRLTPTSRLFRRRLSLASSSSASLSSFSKYAMTSSSGLSR